MLHSHVIARELLSMLQLGHLQQMSFYRITMYCSVSFGLRLDSQRILLFQGTCLDGALEAVPLKPSVRF